jgi:hypothetical protein
MKWIRLACAGLALTAFTSALKAETIYGLTNLQQIVTFDSVTRTVTNTASPPFSILGEILVSIDVRPATGQLYGLTNQNNLYVINPLTGASTVVGAGLGTTLTGNVRSIDFNPTVDRVRIVTSSGQNFRAHPDTGAIVLTDGVLMFMTGDTNQGDTPAVVNAAYTNSLPGATSTNLYVLDAFNNVVAAQNPPNDGKLNTVGTLGFDTVDSGGFIGFDISGLSGIAYLTGNSLAGGGLTANSLYTVNLSGSASLAGSIAGINGTLRDIAVGSVPEPSALAIILLGSVGLMLGMRRGKLNSNLVCVN